MTNNDQQAGAQQDNTGAQPTASAPTKPTCVFCPNPVASDGDQCGSCKRVDRDRETDFYFNPTTGYMNT